MTYLKLLQLLNTPIVDHRRVECEVALVLLTTRQAKLDDQPGLDGWDILEETALGDFDVLIEADDIPYATRSVDAAMEVCIRSMPDQADTIAMRALLSTASKTLWAERTAIGALSIEILAEAVRTKYTLQEGDQRAA